MDGCDKSGDHVVGEWACQTILLLLQVTPSSVSLRLLTARSTSVLSHAARLYRSVDTFLARPRRKQAWKNVRYARDFNNIETRAVIKCFSLARQGTEGNSRHSDRNINLFPSWLG